MVAVIDDAHLLDDGSAALLYELAATRRAFVVVIVRAGEPVPPPVAALWRDELVERVARRVIEQLGPAGIRDVVHELVSGLAQRLIREELAQPVIKGACGGTHRTTYQPHQGLSSGCTESNSVLTSARSRQAIAIRCCAAWTPST